MPRPRARDVGLVIGTLRAGPLNAITDVAGVRVGQVTVIAGDSVNTGVTAILPHGGNVFREKVPAAVSVGNGFGKLTGIAQVRELGELESPIVLTCTLCVPRAADAVLTWLLGMQGNEDVRSINVIVGETNDGFLNAIRSRPIREEHVLEALRSAREGPVEEGSVGAGRGTVAFGWKGGIGTASRRLPERLGGWTVGVLVQSNFGGSLTIGGVNVGEALRAAAAGAPSSADGSIMIVVATDAPLDPRALERLAQRAFLGVARTGSWRANGSGDFAIAFSTAAPVRRGPLPANQRTRQAEAVIHDALSPLFQAVAEATEEAIVNSLLRAETVRGARGTVRALPLDSVTTLLRDRRAIP
ncbi:MAG: aminopeptidase [Gemmatimonadetes bacterium RIFCSPLOWO2_02_FULL_71_11]|nr:MAG: aminopeptidase [Gemmatimonadetes bacterium RIFCSPLOWO2_02_FULL_71_11]